MKVVYEKVRRVFWCKTGNLDVCDTVRQLLDEEGNVMLQTVVRTEFNAPWLTQEMAQELYDWQQSGFQGPPPDWAA